MLYGTRGYLNFSAIPETSINSAGNTITVKIDVDEGPVFHLGPLLLAGIQVPRSFAKKLQDEWRPHIGKINNGDFVDGFITQHLSGFDGKLQITYIQDAKAGTVAVRVEFRKKEMEEGY
jgi:outer membrane protein assembly factor BamA